MADATSFLTRKVGPLPIWTYAVAVAALLALVALYKRGQSSMQAQQPAMPSSPYASSSQGQLNYPPTVVVTPAGVSNTTNPSTTTPSGSSSPTTLQPGSTARIVANGQPGMLVRPGASGASWTLDGYVPDQSIVTISGPATSGLWNTSPFLAVPVTVDGRQTWINAIELQPAGSGGGTLVTHPAHHMGHDWSHFVPFQPQQFVHTGRGGGEGDGGGAPGDGGMGGLSHRTGIPVIRLKSLNYHLRGPDGYRRGIVRIS